MPAYLIALNRYVHDRKKLDPYWVAAGKSFEGVNARLVASYTPLTLLEMCGSLEGAAVVEFPDAAAAKAWYDSPAYQEARKFREGAADVELFIIETGSVAPADRLLHTWERKSK